MQRCFPGPVLVVLLTAAPAASPALAEPVVPRGTIVLEEPPNPRFEFGGPVGDRVRNNAEQWLIPAPANNPGLLEMFARRDAGLSPDLMPWAGEFVGKYLISAVEAMRMSDDPQLREVVGRVVDRLVELQADDGYLGPWPKKERLRGQWDLWGHYHVMLGLLMYHEATGDERAFRAAERIGDLVCDTFLDTNLRVFDAGSHEMNMGIVHGMARLYRLTGNDRYRRMAEEVFRDFERAGDYYRTGLAGEEYYRTPRPRWEGLHSVQGLAEWYWITGDESYRTAFLRHWASIRRFDLRNTGGFSSGEQATGNPYVNSAIETCCVIAWQAVMLDALRLTGDPVIADDLELATLNAAFGAQHPSGAWCTYNTPMAGERGPSHVQIAFQVRPGAPHLNCCSVNGPRGYGMLSEWGAMRRDDGLVLNYYGPMTADVTTAAGVKVRLIEETDYPAGDAVTLTVEPAAPTRFTLGLRMPAWSPRTVVEPPGGPAIEGRPGTYLDLDRTWQTGDRVTVRFPMPVRYEPGDLAQAGRASLYRGPILLALDSRFSNGADARIDVARLGEAKPAAIDDSLRKAAGEYPPWLVVDVPTTDGKSLRMIDFASAGAARVDGTPLSRYETWIAADRMRPPAPVAWRPSDGATIGPGPIAFYWRPSSQPKCRYTVVIADQPAFAPPLVRESRVGGPPVVVPAEAAVKLRPGVRYYWKLIAENDHGASESLGPPKSFVIDPAAPPAAVDEAFGPRESDLMLTAAPLEGDVKPSYGALEDARGWKPAAGPKGNDRGAVELDGTGGMIRYKLFAFPQADYTAAVWVMLTRMPDQHYGQVFSAWSAGLDDPLRLVVTGGKLHARIEAGQFLGADGVPVEAGRWMHVAAVKREGKLTLFLDGQPRATADVPATIGSGSTAFALGGNPRYSGPEFLPCRLADLRFYAKALSEEEVRALFASGE